VAAADISMNEWRLGFRKPRPIETRHMHIKQLKKEYKRKKQEAQLMLTNPCDAFRGQ